MLWRHLDTRDTGLKLESSSAICINIGHGIERFSTLLGVGLAICMIRNDMKKFLMINTVIVQRYYGNSNI